jgi:hypothetical protein
MNTTFIINGGAGRVVSSIPALEKYYKLNPNDNFTVLVQGWESLFWSHPILQTKVFSSNQKGNFDRYIKNSKVVCPEPYHNTDFFNQKINMTQAFDQEINQTKDHSNLNYQCLHLSEYEIAKSADHIEKLKSQKKKRKIVVFQPFGSGAEIADKQVIDRSNRSFQSKAYYKIVQSLMNDCIVLYASLPEFRQANDTFSITFDEMQTYHRMLMCMIYHCDYFIGCCSVGQHVARAFLKPGLVCMGGTSEYNFSYPDHFSIYRKRNTTPTYVPWRLSDIDCEFADRQNNGLMSFDDKELNEIIKIIKQGVGLLTVEKSGDVEVSYD